MRFYAPTIESMAAIPDNHVETDPMAHWEKAPVDTPYGNYDPLACAYRTGWARLPCDFDPEVEPMLFRIWHQGYSDSIVRSAEARRLLRECDTPAEAAAKFAHVIARLTPEACPHRLFDNLTTTAQAA